MEPLGVIYKPGKGYQIRHRCVVCGAESINIAAEDTFQPDDINVITKIIKRGIKETGS